MAAAIEVRDLGKQYRLGLTHAKSLRELVNSAAGRLLGRDRDAEQHAGSEASEFWALRDVSFDVQPGEVIGVIGRNGAGKSTLLKILSRITRPTTGRAVLRGRVASLLEVGTGFHPELTGRENVFLNGTLLGMTKREVEQRFDEIVEFSGIEKFIDTPTKRYSSGMTVRLGFAVAAHLQPEILIVDEVLAVGDVEFQEKCLGKMKEVADSGRTVLFVSHNLASVRQLTTRCLVFRQGDLDYEGSTQDAIHHYVHRGESQGRRTYRVEHQERPFKNLTGALRFVEISLASSRDGLFLDDDELQFQMEVAAPQGAPSFRLGLTIFGDDHSPIGSAFSPEIAGLAAGTTRTWSVSLPDLSLAPGDYYCAMSVTDPRTRPGCELHDSISEVLHFRVGQRNTVLGVLSWHPGWGNVRLSEMRVEVGELP